MPLRVHVSSPDNRMGLQLRFDQRTLGLDYLAVSSNQRACRLHWIFGDQAMFVCRDVFQLSPSRGRSQTLR